MKMPDANDVLALVGLALVGAGVAVVFWPAALIVVGSLLLFAGVLPRVPRRRRP